MTLDINSLLTIFLVYMRVVSFLQWELVIGILNLLKGINLEGQ